MIPDGPVRRAKVKHDLARLEGNRQKGASLPLALIGDRYRRRSFLLANEVLALPRGPR